MRPVFSGGRPAAAEEEVSADEPKVLDADDDDEAADEDDEDEVDELPDEAEIEDPAPDEHH